MNYTRNYKYFMKQSLAAGGIFIALGAVVAFAGLAALGGREKGTGFLVLLVGAGLVVGGVFIIRAQMNGRVSDQEIDQAVATYAEKVRAAALSKLNLDPSEVSSVDPLFVVGYDYVDATMFKLGKDGKNRTNVAEAVVIFFGEDVLHAYKEQYSLTDASFSANETHTYFYKDVVSISTSTGKVDTAIGKITYDEFRLTTSGGTNVGCSILNQSLSERSIQGAKTLVMERKRA